MNYLLRILNHPAALLYAATQLVLSPQTPQADESRSFGQQPHGSRGSGAGLEADQSTAAQRTQLHSPHHLLRGPRLAHAAGDKGFCSGRMRKWGWGRCYTSGAEILCYLQNCIQSEIHSVALLPPSFKHHFFSEVVYEKCL